MKPDPGLFVSALILIACIVLVVFAVEIVNETTPCDYYTNTQIGHIPVRCAAYYGLTTAGGQ